VGGPPHRWFDIREVIRVLQVLEFVFIALLIVVGVFVLVLMLWMLYDCIEDIWCMLCGQTPARCHDCVGCFRTILDVDDAISDNEPE
jgi:uncharacterized membrane protein